MPLLSPEAARAKREQLVADGFAVVPGVMPADLLRAMRQWTEELIATRPVPHRTRYQGSDFHCLPDRLLRKARRRPSKHFVFDEVIGRMNDMPAQREAAELLGLEDLRPLAGFGKEAHVQVISKPPSSPALFWHQDYMGWNSPISATPWPEQIFFNYYLSDTTRENGCLRVIPGSHRNRHALHDVLPNAHEPEVWSLENPNSPIFSNTAGAVDVPVAAGDLIIGDARMLHSTWPNRTDARRTVLLAWYRCFRFPQPPSWWSGPIPPEVLAADPADHPGYLPSAAFRPTRDPNLPWRPRPRDHHALWGAKYPSIRDEAKARL